MIYFKNDTNFDKEMTKVKSILESKGFVLESDHPYAYAMQYGKAFKDVSDWLMEHGCNANLSTLGNSGPYPIAVYGLYDKNKISYEEMLEELNKEAERQMSIV